MIEIDIKRKTGMLRSFFLIIIKIFKRIHITLNLLNANDFVRD